jgi:hypothetical protein
MTVVHVEKGYLESAYLESPYLGGDVDGYMGHQAQFVIAAQPAYGMQCEIIVVDFARATGQQAEIEIGATDALGHQAELTIQGTVSLGHQVEIFTSQQHATGQQANIEIAGSKVIGQQAEFVINDAAHLGQQAEFHINDRPGSLGQQVEIQIVDSESAYAMQYKRDNIAHLICSGYLEDAYLEDAYLSGRICAHAGMQAEFLVSTLNEIGQQAEFHIDNYTRSFGQQVEINIVDAKKVLGQQAEINVNFLRPYGMQAEININDFLRALGMQTEISIVDAPHAIGMQTEFIQQTIIGMQATIALYSPTNLRILCEFPSRGLAGSTGNNAWGNPSGQGDNWKSNSTEAGDFSVSNVNSDLVEQVWRSNAPDTTGINLDCDTERPQGVFLDTFAILNHNLTSSATVTLIGSNTSNFSVIGVSIPLEVRDDDPNIYYIAPTLPNQGYRFWRISIDNDSNPSGYIEIGTIVFGAATIFIGECFVDEVMFQLKDFTDSVPTEGFSNVNNSRAQKKQLQLDFRSLSYLKANFRAMRSMFRRHKTVLKCLWIPTPDPTNQELTSRFALFSKLAEIPSERHNHKGGEANYVNFTINLDESK